MEKQNIPLPPPPKTEFATISLDLIDDPARPIRHDLSPESVEDLVISMRQVGIIEPLVVKPVGKRYEVIAGHRRLVAAGIAGLVEAPCYIVQVTNEQGEMLKIHENLYRADVRPSDEADHFKYLIQHHKLSPVRLSKLIGKSEGYVNDRLAIFNYPPELRQALDLEQIKFSVAREFARMEDVGKMREYLHYAIRSGITPALARQWVIDWRRSLTDAQRVDDEVVVSGGDVPVVEHFSTCIYCNQPIKLAEANVVYIHDHCLKTVQETALPNPNSSS
jgi:ParB/RepB/Spo0J family partition protein